MNFLGFPVARWAVG